MVKLILAGLVLFLLAAGCSGSIKADPEITLHPKDVRGMPVLWLGDEFDSNGDGKADMKLTLARRVYNEEVRLADGTLVIPEVRYYKLAYGDCEIPPGASGCPIPVSIQLSDPCDAQPLARGAAPEVVAVRGMSVDKGRGLLHVETADFALTINALAETPDKSNELALRVLNELHGANPEASDYARETPFKPRPAARLCK
jgi:hypothetical protein